jgi:splicing factor 45
MMAKMGWSDGMGLGKNNQGMNTPLMAKKTDTHSAVIVNAAQKDLLPAAKKPRTNFGCVVMIPSGCDSR